MFLLKRLGYICNSCADILKHQRLLLLLLLSSNSTQASIEGNKKDWVWLHVDSHMVINAKTYCNFFFRLPNCNLSEKVYSLTSLFSSLTRLNLSNNKHVDSRMEQLCSALSHQDCKLEKLQ